MYFWGRFYRQCIYCGAVIIISYDDILAAHFRRYLYCGTDNGSWSGNNRKLAEISGKWKRNVVLAREDQIGLKWRDIAENFPTVYKLTGLGLGFFLMLLLLLLLFLPITLLLLLFLRSCSYCLHHLDTSKSNDNLVNRHNVIQLLIIACLQTI